MFKKFCVVLIISLVLGSCFVSDSRSKEELTIGEAFEIACKEFSGHDVLNTDKHTFAIYVNADFKEMENVAGQFVTQEEIRQRKAIGKRKYVAVHFKDKNWRGAGGGITYYVDLVTGEIFYVIGSA